ncbi:MAG TPA: rod shape-determining protein MreD [Acidobacteriaceae bacterium]|nr:rod shape-determining protein MreD [Acidobacteriaceae bacterium]
MPEHSYTSRAELDQYAFRPIVTVLAPLLCILLQAMLPKTWAKFNYVDLPLIATIFFAVARRNPITGTITGTLIGLLQDGLTNHPFGVYGIAKAIIGYIAASIGFAVDVDNMVNRVLLNFGFSLVQSGMLYLITRRLLADPSVHLQPVHELVCAVVNAIVAIPVFLLLDRFKLRE